MGSDFEGENQSALLTNENFLFSTSYFVKLDNLVFFCSFEMQELMGVISKA